MSRSGEGRFEEIARKARRVQQSVELIRATASTPDVRIEVTADGRITTLHLADQALAQAISTTHELAHRKALAQAAEQRGELIHDPAVAALLRRILQAEPPVAAGCAESAGVSPGAVGYLPPGALKGADGQGNRGSAWGWSDPGAAEAGTLARKGGSDLDSARRQDDTAAGGGRPVDERPDANPYALPRAVARRYGLR
ncbi:YbaB/EbfC family nucleoid-associated protein [Nocardia sp. NPDC056000]|uniref:YbaB/EbfC family nucleoid-associated protein n=1 Tax=Nocardia sp. NPDC056000 TaxID=3345674 RepID=UPI0035D609BA